jgi:hypothetical protein
LPPTLAPCGRIRGSAGSAVSGAWVERARFWGYSEIYCVAVGGARARRRFRRRGRRSACAALRERRSRPRAALYPRRRPPRSSSGRPYLGTLASRRVLRAGNAMMTLCLVLGFLQCSTATMMGAPPAAAAATRSSSSTVATVVDVEPGLDVLHEVLDAHSSSSSSSNNKMGDQSGRTINCTCSEGGSGCRRRLRVTICGGRGGGKWRR